MHIQALVSADVILPGSSSKLRLLVINLASVPGGQLVNSPTAQSLERWVQLINSMIRLFISLFISFSLLSSCSRSAHVSIHLPTYLVALNEDSLNTHQITLLQNYNFYYAIIKKVDNSKQVESFKGTFKISADSIFLNYNKTEYSPETTDYLFWDSSKTYLIQDFKSGQPRIFLQIQKPN